MTLNWISNLILSFTFEYIVEYLANYTFLVFSVVVGFSVIFLFKKVSVDSLYCRLLKNMFHKEITHFFSYQRQRIRTWMKFWLTLMAAQQLWTPRVTRLSSQCCQLQKFNIIEFSTVRVEVFTSLNYLYSFKYIY